MKEQEARDRIRRLKREINHHRYLYHVLDRIEISDDALDSLKHGLRQLEEMFPRLITADSPTQRVGGVALEKFSKVKHDRPMLSLDDVFEKEEVVKWRDRIQKLIPSASFTYFVEQKIDGFAISLMYDNGVLGVGYRLAFS